MNSIAVIGAGWAGIAAALTLSRAGAHVSIYEAAQTPGGRARRVDRDGRSVDNGQHLLLGAYERTTSLIRSLHPASEVPLLALPLTLRSAPNTMPSLGIRAPEMPEPWNLLVGLIAADGLRAAEKIAAITWAARILRGSAIDPLATVAALIAEQPMVMRQLIWAPLCIAALNTPPEKASAVVFVEVLRRTFAGEKKASRMIIPTTDLTAVFPAPALAEIETRGGNIRIGTAATSVINTEDGAAVVWGDSTHYFDAVITAVAPQHVPRLLSREPAADLLADSLKTLTYEPITTLYFEFAYVSPSPDNGVPMRMLDGEPGQWLFWSRLHTGGWRAAVVISAHHRSEDEASLVASTLHQLARSYRLPVPIWRFVITEKRATYSCSPAQTKLLSSLPKSIGRIHLAGDWCCPDLPATIEAAVISGENAANAALKESLNGR